MPIFEAMPMTEQQERSVELLARVIDTLAEDVVSNYSGSYEQAKAYALSQAEREVEALLVDLVRAKRTEPVAC